MTPTRIEVLGVPVDCVNMQSAVEYVRSLAEAERTSTVFAVNPEKVMRSREDARILQLLRSATLLIPDGIGVVWAARLLRHAKLKRVAGADLMISICSMAARNGYRVYLYGATVGVNAAARAALRSQFPELQIAGGRDGYVSEEQMPGLLNEINTSGAQIVFVAMGSPRQEEWIAQHAATLKGKVCQGVGGTFDVIAGNVRRAPGAWRAVNLEWAYRLLSDPRRLRRQTALPIFAACVLRQWLAQARNGDRDRGPTNP